MSAKPCVFFDRDGIINRSPGPGYVERLEDFHIYPEFIDAMRVVDQKGYKAVVITNQRGVVLGRMTLDTVNALHEHLNAELAKEGLSILDFFVCPHENGHPDRKPEPRMILTAADKHNLDLSRSWMIGDKESDVKAGKGAGCKAIIVNQGIEHSEADHILDDMGALAGLLEEIL